MTSLMKDIVTVVVVPCKCTTLVMDSTRASYKSFFCLASNGQEMGKNISKKVNVTAL